jgi:hypothetical protein
LSPDLGAISCPPLAISAQFTGGTRHVPIALLLTNYSCAHPFSHASQRWRLSRLVPFDWPCPSSADPCRSLSLSHAYIGPITRVHLTCSSRLRGHLHLHSSCLSCNTQLTLLTNPPSYNAVYPTPLPPIVTSWRAQPNFQSPAQTHPCPQVRSPSSSASTQTLHLPAPAAPSSVPHAPPAPHP